jgi:TRAP-type C4-dicarboxylate transport system substrate-binding protein
MLGRKSLIVVVVLAALALALSIPPALAQSKAKYTLKFGHLANEENTWHKGALKFAELAAAKSKGQIEVKVYPNEQLGKEMELINGLQMGTVDLTISGESMQNWAPKAALMAAPYGIRDLDHMVKVAGGELGKEIEQEIVQKVGVRPIT